MARFQLPARQHPFDARGVQTCWPPIRGTPYWNRSGSITSRRLGILPDNAVCRRIVAVPPRRDRPPQRVPLVAVVAVVSCRSPSLAAVTRCSPLATLGPVALAKGARHSQLPSHGSPLARVSAGAGAGAGDGEAIVQQAPSFAAGRTEGGASAPPVVAGGGSERSHGSWRPGEGRG